MSLERKNTNIYLCQKFSHQPNIYIIYKSYCHLIMANIKKERKKKKKNTQQRVNQKNKKFFFI